MVEAPLVSGDMVVTDDTVEGVVAEAFTPVALLLTVPAFMIRIIHFREHSGPTVDVGAIRIRTYAHRCRSWRLCGRWGGEFGGGEFGRGRGRQWSGAGLHVASGGRAQSGANDATVESGVDDRTSPGLGAGGTGLGARAVSRPTGNFAVDGASEGVASGGRAQSEATNATVDRSVDDRTSLCLRAGAAGLGARGVTRPTGHFAVDGARKGLAGGGRAQSGATNATVRGSGEDRASPSLEAGAAGLGARAVARPTGHGAVDGTGELLFDLPVRSAISTRRA